MQQPRSVVGGRIQISQAHVQVDRLRVQLRGPRQVVDRLDLDDGPSHEAAPASLELPRRFDDRVGPESGANRGQGLLDVFASKGLSLHLFLSSA